MVLGAYANDGTSNILWYTWAGSGTSAATWDGDTWCSWNTSTDSTATTYFEQSDGIWRQWQPSIEYRPAAIQPARQRVYAHPKEDIERARRKAEQLLMEHLTTEQKAMYRRLKKFRVVSSEGKTYELDARKQYHNIFELDGNGRRVKEFCIYQRGGAPLADNHLGQKLLLEADEPEFKRIANMMQLSRASA